MTDKLKDIDDAIDRYPLHIHEDDLELTKKALTHYKQSLEAPKTSEALEALDTVFHYHGYVSWHVENMDKQEEVFKALLVIRQTLCLLKNDDFNKQNDLSVKSDNQGVHLAHCNQGEYLGGCKYGEVDACQALTNQVKTDTGEESASYWKAKYYSNLIKTHSVKTDATGGVDVTIEEIEIGEVDYDPNNDNVCDYPIPALRFVFEHDTAWPYEHGVEDTLVLPYPEGEILANVLKLHLTPTIPPETIEQLEEILGVISAETTEDELPSKLEVKSSRLFAKQALDLLKPYRGT